MASYQCQNCNRFVDLDKDETPEDAIENILCEKCFNQESKLYDADREMFGDDADYLYNAGIDNMGAK